MMPASERPTARPSIRALVAALSVALASALWLSVAPAAHADPALWPDDIGYSWGNGYPSDFKGTVKVGDVTFYYPDSWSLAYTTDNLAVITIVSPTTYEKIGTITLRSESVYGTAYQNLVPQEVFAYKCAAAFADGVEVARAWAPERIDMAGDPMAKASYARISNKGLTVGNLYMALTPEGRYYEMLSEVDAEEIRGVEERIGVVWDAASWLVPSSAGSSATAGTGSSPAGPEVVPGFDKETYIAHTLGVAQEAYAESPWYNPYWEVVDFTCDFDDSTDPAHPIPIDEIYSFQTPDGWVGTSYNIALMNTNYGTGPDASVFNHWCLWCYDSEGEMYYRTSAYVYGLGYVCDLAYYPGYSDCWYVAKTGQAVYTDWEGDWVTYGEWGEPAWTPHFFD